MLNHPLWLFLNYYQIRAYKLFIRLFLSQKFNENKHAHKACSFMILIWLSENNVYRSICGHIFYSMQLYLYLLEIYNFTDLVAKKKVLHTNIDIKPFLKPLGKCRNKYLIMTNVHNGGWWRPRPMPLLTLDCIQCLNIHEHLLNL